PIRLNWPITTASVMPVGGSTVSFCSCRHSNTSGNSWPRLRSSRRARKSAASRSIRCWKAYQKAQATSNVATKAMRNPGTGLRPASDYTPFTLNDDKTRGGFARLATLIAKRKAARKDLGPVLILDAGDYSMGTAFAAAIRETGGKLQLMSRMGYDATTFGNHD